jgi:hypothetical protein
MNSRRGVNSNVMWFSNSHNTKRAVRIILIVCSVASTAGAQNSEAILIRIERGSQRELPQWSIDLRSVQSPQSGVMRWKSRNSDNYISVGLLILNDAQQARVHFDEMISEDIELFRADKSVFAKTKIAGVGDENCLFTFRDGNPSLTLRKGKYFVTVDGASLGAVKAFARVVANQLPAT